MLSWGTKSVNLCSHCMSSENKRYMHILYMIYKTQTRLQLLPNCPRSSITWIFFITWTFGLSSSLSKTSVRELFFLIRTSKLEVRVSNYPLPALLIRRLPEMDYLRSLRTNISRYAVLKANRPQKHRHAVPGQPYSSYDVSFKSIKSELLNEGYRAVSRTSDTFRPSWFALVLAMDRPGKNPLSAYCPLFSFVPHRLWTPVTSLNEVRHRES